MGPILTESTWVKILFFLHCWDRHKGPLGHMSHDLVPLKLPCCNPNRSLLCFDMYDF